MDARLVCPITVNTGNTFEGSDAVLDAAFSSSFSVLAAPSASVVTGGTSATVPETICLGCRDGSVLVLRASPSSETPPASSNEPTPLIQRTAEAEPQSGSPRSRVHNLPLSISAPSGTSKKLNLPFNAPHNLLSAPTRAVSDLNAVSAEAPKVFVRHDEEEGKLRTLLAQNAQPRDASVLDLLQRPFEKDIQLDPESPPAELKRQTVKPMKSKLIIKPSLHDASSPASTRSSSPAPRSRHASSAISPTLPYQLQYHILPPQTGPNEAVTAVEYLSDGHYILVLQESGNVAIYSSVDGTSIISLSLDGPPRCRAPEGWEDVPLDNRAWKWSKLDVLSLNDESVIVCLTAFDPFEFSQLDVTDGDLPWTTRIAVLQVNASNLREVHLEQSSAFELLAEWVTTCPSAGCGIVRLDKVPSIEWAFYRILDSKLYISDLTIQPRVSAVRSSPGGSHVDLLTGAANALQALPQNFAALSKELRLQWRPRHPRQPSLYMNGKEEMQKLPLGRITLASPEEIAALPELCPPVKGSSYWSVSLFENYQSSLAVWSENAISVFAINNEMTVAPLVSFEPEVGQIELIEPLSDAKRLIITGTESVAIFEIAGDPSSSSTKASCIHRIRIDRPSLSCLNSSNGLLRLSNADSAISLTVMSLERLSGATSMRSADTLWQLSRLNVQSSSSKNRPQVISMLPLELQSIVIGYSDGHIGISTLAAIFSGADKARNTHSDQPLDGPITGLHLTTSHSGDKCVVGSCEDGSFAVWDLGTLRLRARWTVFCCPLRRVITLPPDHAGRLKGCMICMAEDGTLAVVALDGFEMLYLVPGSVAPIERIYVGADNLLLLYGNARTRLWDTRTLEFWRSMGQDKVIELLDQGGWFDFVVERPRPMSNAALLGHIENHADTADLGRTFLIDFVPFLECLTHRSHGKSHKPLRSITDPDPSIEVATSSPKPLLDADEAVPMLRGLLSTVLTYGVDDAIDKLCTDSLGAPPGACTSSGRYSADGSTVIYANNNPTAPWEISPTCTARRLLLIVVALRASLIIPNLTQTVNDIISFYVHSLSAAVGPNFQPPSMVYLASFWFDPSVEIRQAARTLFDASVTQATDEATLVQLEAFQHELPSIQPDSQKNSPRACLGLILCANVAIEKVSLLSTSTLTDISKSILLYLHDESSPHRAVAVDLGARGFHLWQNYISAMELLRSLFRLTTFTSVAGTSSVDKEKGRIIAQHARSGVLHIAASATPLFVSTISLDIMDATSVVHRNSTMQLIAFIIRKKPMILFPNLPRLVEAVVKSLDPNWSSKRDAVLDSAIEFLGEVVRTYPTIDFHAASQKLAVGTSEGVVLMYDLKTASRLYVLEGHKKRLDACTFSPDGRRLVTLCLDDGVVMVWKVGASFSNLFTLPGAPPRQGGASGSDPFKTFPITMPPASPGSKEATDPFHEVAFTWPALRSARLTIRESVFTFAT